MWGLIIARGPAAANAAESMTTNSEVLTEDAPPQSMPEKIDGAFAPAVALLEKGLFHRLFKTEREYVTYSHREVYVRDRGTTGVFTRMGATGDASQELTDRDIRFMAARGELLEGQTIDDEPRQYRWGRIGTRLVESITVRVPHEVGDLVLRDGDKFVKTKDARAVFAKVGPMRGLLDMNAVLSDNDIESLTKQGLLATNTVKASDGKESTITIQPESVGGIPIIVLWLGVGGVIATIYLRFVNFWGFYHAIECVGGKYDNPNEPG